MIFLFTSIVILTLAGFLFYMYRETFKLELVEYEIELENLPKDLDNFTILFLTDTHSKDYGDNQRELLKLIDKNEFKIVILTGDLVNNKCDLAPVETIVKHLSDKPIFFVPGNHDWWTNYDTIKDLLVSHKVHILENQNYKLKEGLEHLWIIGIDDPHVNRDNLEQALIGIDDNRPRILLSHSPNIFAEAVEEGIDLILVGHTHGGQVRIPLIGSLVVPGQGLFPKYDYGKFTSQRTTMIISGGLGESLLPIRLGIRPEIVLLTLKSKGK